MWCFLSSITRSLSISPYDVSPFPVPKPPPATGHIDIFRTRFNQTSICLHALWAVTHLELREQGVVSHPNIVLETEFPSPLARVTLSLPTNLRLFRTDSPMHRLVPMWPILRPGVFAQQRFPAASVPPPVWHLKASEPAPHSRVSVSCSESCGLSPGAGGVARGSPAEAHRSLLDTRVGPGPQGEMTSNDIASGSVHWALGSVPKPAVLSCWTQSVASLIFPHTWV